MELERKLWEGIHTPQSARTLFIARFIEHSTYMSVVLPSVVSASAQLG
jgi:hypothetical protein